MLNTVFLERRPVGLHNPAVRFGSLERGGSSGRAGHGLGEHARGTGGVDRVLARRPVHVLGQGFGNLF